jgi:hypothetical protein
MRWYKRNIDAAISGMIGLSMEERGAYNTILDYLYDREGVLPDDDAKMATIQQCNIQKWRRVKATLISKGKIRVTDGNLIEANGVSATLAEKNIYINRQKVRRNFKVSASLQAKNSTISTPKIDQYTIYKDKTYYDSTNQRNPISGQAGTPYRTSPGAPPQAITLADCAPSKHLLAIERQARPTPQTSFGQPLPEPDTNDDDQPF